MLGRQVLVKVSDAAKVSRLTASQFRDFKYPDTFLAWCNIIQALQLNYEHIQRGGRKQKLKSTILYCNVTPISYRID